jgi:hypothetical protein
MLCDTYKAEAILAQFQWLSKSMAVEISRFHKRALFLRLFAPQ